MVRVNKTGSRLNFGPGRAFPSLHGTDHTSGMWIASEASSAWPRGGHEIPDVFLSFSNHADVQSQRNPAVLM